MRSGGLRQPKACALHADSSSSAFIWMLQRWSPVVRQVQSNRDSDVTVSGLSSRCGIVTLFLALDTNVKLGYTSL